MKVVWEHSPVTVRDVYQRLLERRQVAYTTVMTMMNILEQKGYLKKAAGTDRAFVYEPAQPRKAVIRGMVREFLERVFNGSADPLMAHLIEDKHISKKDLDDLRKSLGRKA